MADLSVVIVNYNTEHLLHECLGHLRSATEGLVVQLIVIDNASRDGSVQLLRRDFPEIELIVNEVNVGFGRANNQALPLLRSEAVLLLNTDAFVAPAAVRHAMAYIERHPDVGVVGARLLSRDGTLQPSCRYFPTLVNLFAARSGLWRLLPRLRMIDDMTWDHATPRICDWVPGCFYLTRREVLQAVGLFDARYFLYMEEVDHCRAVQRGGWKVAYVPSCVVVHIGGESAKSDAPVSAAGRQISALQLESELLYFRKWLGLGGALLHVALSLLAAAISTLRSIAGRRSKDWFRAQWSSVRLLCRLAGQTALGARPTR